jgi:hypothetical protein
MRALRNFCLVVDDVLDQNCQGVNIEFLAKRVCVGLGGHGGVCYAPPRLAIAQVQVRIQWK